MGNLALFRFEARVRFTTDAELPLWPGNALRSGFGARLREIVCVNTGAGSSFDPTESCEGCPHRKMCVYDRFYNARPPDDAKVLRKQSYVPSPFVLIPPASGRYGAGEGAVLGFTLFGGVDYLPYFILALRNLGESGLGRGYKQGFGRYSIELIDSLGLGKRECVFSGDTVFNKAVSTSYAEILNGSEDLAGKVMLRFTTPTQIKENDRYTAKPSFRGLVSRLLSRANTLAEFQGEGMLYDNRMVLNILGSCRDVEVTSSKTTPVHQERYFRNQGKKAKLPPFFVGEITYSGEFSKDVVALLRLGEVVHVGKMATFGNGRYSLDAR